VLELGELQRSRREVLQAAVGGGVLLANGSLLAPSRTGIPFGDADFKQLWLSYTPAAHERTRTGGAIFSQPKSDGFRPGGQFC
jgi:hypothetical protein